MSVATPQEMRLAATKAERAQREVDQMQDAIKIMERVLRLQLDELGKFKLTASGIGPCSKCNRHVPSPCDDAEGFHTGGPWDGSCREFFS